MTSSDTITVTPMPALLSPEAAIPAAIARIMAGVGTVEKRGTNSFHNYKFATAADILHALQPLMAEHGLVVMQTELSMEFLREGTVLAITYGFDLVHVSGAVWHEPTRMTGLTSCVNKGNFDDKAANKCHTAAEKYFLISLFKIPTGDYADGDADGDTATPRSPPPPVVRKATPDPLPPLPPVQREEPPPAREEPAREEFTFDPPKFRIEPTVNAKGGTAWAAWLDTFEIMVEACDNLGELELLEKENIHTLTSLREIPRGGAQGYARLFGAIARRGTKLREDAAKPDGLAA